jgi:hypothetical protein
MSKTVLRYESKINILSNSQDDSEQQHMAELQSNFKKPSQKPH